jgi:ribonuclease P protein component
VAPSPQIFLKKHADYQAAYALARKGRSPLMGWFCAPRPPERRSATEGTRIGLTVPKALGKAVDRNRIKRRMRAAVRTQPPQLLAQPLDLILHPRRTVLDCDFARLVSEVERVLREAAKPSPAAARP